MGLHFACGKGEWIEVKDVKDIKSVKALEHPIQEIMASLHRDTMGVSVNYLVTRSY
nr:hypothetical protein Itr_chr13CG06830 [Ipomoea trifida]